METQHTHPHHHPHQFIEQLPQPGSTTTDEALLWGEQCNQQHLSFMGEVSGLALSHLAYAFFVAASFAKNSAVSGEAYYRLWQMESEGRAPHSTTNRKENRDKGLVYLRQAALQEFPAALRLISLVL
jgi:hypothetical protein